jgi:hypothetical protein
VSGCSSGKVFQRPRLSSINGPASRYFATVLALFDRHFFTMQQSLRTQACLLCVRKRQFVLNLDDDFPNGFT